MLHKRSLGHDDSPNTFPARTLTPDRGTIEVPWWRVATLPTPSISLSVLAYKDAGLNRRGGGRVFVLYAPRKPTTSSGKWTRDDGYDDLRCLGLLR